MNNSDPTGLFTLAVIAGFAITASTVALIVAVFTLAVLYATNSTFRNTVNNIISLLVEHTITAVKSFASVITSIVKIARTSRKYNSNEKHHIVAKKDHRAKDSRIILGKYNINVDDKCNLVSIRKTLHKHLHTNAYHNCVYSILKSVDKGKTKKTIKYKIQGALMFIGFVLKGAGNLCK